jgi:pimeloyl-ACP methyl ester carboxylesterase
MPFAMLLVLIPALVAALALLVLWFLVVLVRSGLPPFRRTAKVFVVLFVPSLLLAEPIAIGYFATRQTRTRSDEARYRGPVLGADGRLREHDLAAFRRGAEDRGAVAESGETRAEVVELTAGDGVRLRAFHLAPRATPRAAAVVTHGLWRGGLEVEPVAAMLLELGVAVLVVELRGHGGSATASCTFGRDESLDVLAGAQLLREREPGLPLVLFGVSLGAAATALAAPRLSPPPAAVILDSPMESADGALRRMLAERVGLAEPFALLTRFAIDLFSGGALREVRPAESLSRLDPAVRVLIVAGADDELMPVPAVERVYAALRAPADRREIWIVDDAGHGKAWLVARDAYFARLSHLIARVVE